MAVYTDIPDEELRAFVADYGIGEVTSYMGIAQHHRRPLYPHPL
jgi:homoserine kinase type II